jgi:hypothetical protein
MLGGLRMNTSPPKTLSRTTDRRTSTFNLDLFRSLTLSSDIERAISEKVLEKSGGKKGGK